MSHYISNTSLSKYCHLPPIPVIISVEGDYGAPNLLRDRGPLCGGLRLHYYGRGSHLPGETPPAGPISCLKCGPSGGVPGNPFAGPAWGGPRRLEIPPPPRMIPERIRSPSPRHHTISHAQWWGAPVGPRSKAPSRFPS